MSCEHEVRFTIKPTDDACRFHFDVRAYKDRIVAPDEYSGVTEVTPSDSEQVLPTKDKLVRDDITVLPAPTEVLSTDHNGTFTPSDGKVGFSQVDVDVNPDLRPLSVSENGTYEPDGFDGYSDVTVDVEPNLTSLSVTENGLYLPESGVDGFDRVNVDVPVPSGSTTITENGTYNVEQYASAVVDVLPAISIDGICTGAEPSGNITVNADTIRDYVFSGCPITGIDAPNCTYLGIENFKNNTNLAFAHFPKCTKVGNSAFISSKYGYDSDFVTDFPNVETIGGSAFRECGFRKIILPETLKSISASYAFMWQMVNRVEVLTEVYFRSTPTAIHSQCFSSNRNLTDIYVPWSQGEVANAPWGATSATIHYDTVYDSEWNIISST